MSCSIFSDNLFNSASLSSPTINKDVIRELFVPYRAEIDGTWLPLVVKPSTSRTTYCELLAAPSLKNTAQFDPCTCNNDVFGYGSGVDDIFNSQDILMGDLSECSYCNDTCDPGDPCDMEEDDEEPDKQFCDVRFNRDDYVPKIPYVHQGYISGFSDFKHMGQFPACSNPGLGIEKFISLNTYGLPKSAGKIYIDWKLQESISEIPYDIYSSQHDTEYVHNKAYTKSLNNKTCGNFISKFDAVDGNLPKTQDFTKPFGFANQTYDNIFTNGEKLGSHWKWNYQSGILGWYRHYDRNRSNDKRPFAGIDLFIPSGDVFYAKNHGPEVPRVVEDEDEGEGEGSELCPSGLKLVKGATYRGMFSHNTEFIYISSNIYDKVLEARNRLQKVEIDDDVLFDRSLLLATHPEYDNIITDLLDPDIKENRNEIGQLKTLNTFMTRATDFKSVGRINYCRNDEDLIKTLLHKYGCYLFLGPNEKHSLQFDTEVASQDSYYIDMSFDMVIKNNTNRFNLYPSYDTSSKFLPNVPQYDKKYVYEQEIKVGEQSVIKTDHNAYSAYNQTCYIDENDTPIREADDYINVSMLYAWGYNSLGRLSNNSGQYSFTDRYRDGRLNHDRIYPASAFNPHVDLVAVHSQGGVYANALPFSVRQKSIFTNSVTQSPGGAITIDFDNKDCGIKIYDLKISKLQSKKENSKRCLRFPFSIEESCKCYGFGTDFFNDNLNRDFAGDSSKAQNIYGLGSFVPGLSTKNSPRLKKYGGYSVEYMNDLFGSNGHQQTRTPALITNITRYIDPLYPYGNERQTSITLPNYVNSSWTLNTKGIQTNQYMDVIVEVSENVNLTANRFSGDPASEDYLSNHNMAWKRFTTEVKINNKTIYDKQGTTVPVSLGGDLSVKLHNPFLAKLVNDRETAYAPPDSSENLMNFSPKLYSVRGDESSQVTLTFTAKPRKQLLNFVIPPPTPYGTLNRGRFVPDRGLTSEAKNKSPFVNNRLYTEYDFSTKNDSDLEDNKGTYYGSITETMRKLCNQVSDFAMSRKLKLYIKRGSTWYVVGSQKKGGYTQNGIQYIGRPRFFEYISNTKNSQNIPLLFPVAPAKLNSWYFQANHASINNRSVYNPFSKSKLLSSYPALNGLTASISLNKMIMDGSRYFFMVDEKISVITPLKTVEDPEDPEETIAVPIDNIKDIASISNSSALFTGAVVEVGSAYYFYNGGDVNLVDSYLLLGNSYEEILSTPSSLAVDYSKIADSGYVYNSFKSCDQTVIVYLNNDGFITPIRDRYKITTKRLLVQGYDENKRPVVKNAVYHKLITLFEFNHNLNPIKDKIFSIDIANKDVSSSISIFYPVDDIDGIGSSTDYSKYLNFNYKGLIPIYDEDGNIEDYYYDIIKSYRTKWADVLGLSDPNQMTTSIVDNLDIKSLFPNTPYNNWFYKQIINNYESRCDFELRFRNKYTGAIDSDIITFNDVNPTYCILQKYNLERPELTQLSNAELYQNFIPIMDITMHNKTFPSKYWDVDQAYDGSNTGIPLEGILKSPNFTRNLNKGEFSILPNDLDKPESSDLFWTEVTDKDTIGTSFVPTSTVYNDTLRLDDPLFWLDSTYKTTQRNTEGVRTTFTPGVNTLSTAGLALPGFTHEIKSRDYAFSIHNIYGDGDDPDKCGAQNYSSCFMSTRGSVNLYAKLKIATPIYTSTISAGQYFTTYDAGSYNPLGQRNIITISRSQLTTDNPIDSAFDHCSTNYLRPDYKRTFLDPERKTEITTGFKTPHTQATKNIDAYANEMLFRIMYGDDGDIVNRAILLSKKRPLNADNLVNFTDPKITAADVYDEILYNYDRKVDCGTAGSFSVNGPRKIGDYYDFTVGNKNIYFSIEDYGTGDIRAAGRIGGKTFSVRISGTPNIKTGVVVTDTNTNLSSTENITYTYQMTSASSRSVYYGPVAGRVYTGKCGVYVANDAVRFHSQPYVLGTEQNKYVHPRFGSVSHVEITNCAGRVAGSRGMTDIHCVGNPEPIFQGEPCGTYTSEKCADKSCDDYEIGYCRRKSGCNTDKCDGEEDMENFLYTFWQCRTKFTLYGHRYKTLNIEEPAPEDEEDTTDDTDTGDDTGDDNNDDVIYDGGQGVGCGVTVRDGNIPTSNYPYGGGVSYNWRGSTVWSGFSTRLRGGTGSLCGAGNGIHGGNRGLANVCSTTRGARIPYYHTRSEPGGNFGSDVEGTPYPQTEWWREQIDACESSDDSPRTGDPGYDVCGYIAPKVLIPARKYYTFKQVSDVPDWDGRCPTHVCTISYTNNSVSITIAGETICDEADFSGCPTLQATMPEYSHISSENTNIETPEELQINLPSQRQNYQTITYSKNIRMGGISGGDLNPQAGVRTGAGFTCGLWSGPYGLCKSSGSAICGSSGAQWRARPGGAGAYVDAKGTFSQGAAAWRERMKSAFNNINKEIGAEVGWFNGGPAGDGGAKRARNVCNANRHISSANMIQGIVPGSCSDIWFSTKTDTYSRYRVSGDGVQSGTWNVYTIRAYVTVSYTRPVTIQDKLKGWSPDSDSYACADDPLGSTGYAEAYDDFPEWYAQTLGIETRDTLGYPIQNYGRTGNYIRRKTWINKSTSCGESLTSSTPEDYNKGGDHNYPFGGAPCGRTDYVCWADNRDWISVWLE